MATGHALSTWLFLRLFGVVCFIAFVSFWTQAHGLVGSQGILPAEPFFAAVRERFGLAEGIARFPALFWIVGAGDGALHAVCGAGAALSLSLAAGVAPGPCLLGIYACYLSLSTAGRVFMGFQWDGLLLETALVGTLLAPWRGSWTPPGRAPEPAAVARVLVLFLLVRLMFASGAVKLLSGDELWTSLRALEVHYETQPLPTWAGWWAHQLPASVQRASCAAMFAIELGAPLLIFWPRPWPRRVAFAALVSLQVLIAATGSYGFFNLLAIALCVPLLDDAGVRRVLPAALARRLEPAEPAPPPPAPRALLVPAGILALLGALNFLGGLAGFRALPGPVLAVLGAAQPFELASPYGLFAVMTPDRPEIVIEGSLDGREWRAYELPWKPGDPLRAPRLNAPHQPRLDWQLWFAALSDWRRNPWVEALLVRLLEGAPPVLALFERNPFPDGPPRHVRAVVYDYRFTSRDERRATGAYWRRQEQGLYGPVLSRRD